MKLKRLIDQIEDLTVKGSKEIEITGLCENSNLVCPGNLFIAKKGSSHDGARFIEGAVAAGANCVLTDLYDPFLSVTQLIHPDVRQIEGLIAARYYNHPSKELKVVGITGTNGKTTTGFLTRHMLEKMGMQTGLIGTVDWIVGQSRMQGARTTPDVITCHKLLREMVTTGCKAAVMEVSSHGLDQQRVEKIDFDVAVFTNLSEEHLDYHGTMETYAEAKSKLFEQLSDDKVAILNVDDPIHFETKARVLTYGIHHPADLMGREVQLSEKKLEFIATYEGKRVPITSKLIGGFNVSNILAAIATCFSLGYSIEECAQSLKSFSGVKGRLQRIQNKLDLHIFVDFAHSPGALENVLKTIQTIKKGKLITVFGAGGDRDREKRPLMGKIAEQLSDLCIVTSDNPRSEDPQVIAREIAAGFEEGAPIIELDRKKAITKAIESAKMGDVVLIAGKGHEASQEFAHRVVPFDDVETAREICREKEGICG